MRTLESFLNGSWTSGPGTPALLVNPATEETLAHVAPAGSLAAAVAYGRDVGGPALRALTFRQRGALLQALAKKLHGEREALIDLAVTSGGNTRGDAKFDIDGGLGVLAAYAELAETLGDDPWLPSTSPPRSCGPARSAPSTCWSRATASPSTSTPSTSRRGA
jgi:3,4-dehydroadipyl-CoA semialdehyde dehydrogenase